MTQTKTSKRSKRNNRSQSELLTSSQREAIDTGNVGHDESRAARGLGSDERRRDSIGGSIVSSEDFSLKKKKENDDGDDGDAPREIRKVKRNDVESESTETTSLPAIRATQTQSQSQSH